MKKREFNKVINQCTITRKKVKILDLEKVKTLSNENKDNLVKFIVRNRGPVLSELISDNLDRKWFASCGYLYTTTGKESGLTFVHTSASSIR